MENILGYFNHRKCKQSERGSLAVGSWNGKGRQIEKAEPSLHEIEKQTFVAGGPAGLSDSS